MFLAIDTFRPFDDNDRQNEENDSRTTNESEGENEETGVQTIQGFTSSPSIARNYPSYWYSPVCMLLFYSDDPDGSKHLGISGNTKKRGKIWL